MRAETGASPWAGWEPRLRRHGRVRLSPGWQAAREAVTGCAGRGGERVHTRFEWRRNCETSLNSGPPSSLPPSASTPQPVRCCWSRWGAAGRSQRGRAHPNALWRRACGQNSFGSTRVVGPTGPWTWRSRLQRGCLGSPSSFCRGRHCFGRGGGAGGGAKIDTSGAGPAGPGHRPLARGRSRHLASAAKRQ